MNRLLYTLSLLLLLSLNSCMSLLDFQSAKTLGKGKNEINASMTSVNLKNDRNHTTPYVTPTIGFTRGISDNFDAGVTVQPFGLSAIHGKFQFTDREIKKYAFAGMMKLGYVYAFGDAWENEYLDGFSTSKLDLPDNIDDFTLGNYRFGDLYVETSILGSYFINKEMAVTSTLKFVYLPVIGIYTMGNSYGFEVGKKVKFSLNAGYNFYWEDQYTQKGFLVGNWQYGLGVKKLIKFKSKKEEPKTLN